jgi:lysine 2,3-aminomutase
MNNISESFDNWQWQIKNSMKSIEDLKNFLPLSAAQKQWLDEHFAKVPLPFMITPYVASLMDNSAQCPIFSQMISSQQELVVDDLELRDPLGEEEREKVPHLVHRYPDRVLFLATDRCASYCRFCTRKRMVGQGPTPRRDQQEDAFRYIEQNSAIKEIIFSGGDPLMLSNNRLDELFSRAVAISHIEILRIHSRMLSFAPMRIDQELVDIFKRYAPLYLVTHFNHPKELSKQALSALHRLHESGIIILNQSVLLKNINDSAEILSELNRTLVRNRVRPYYLHLCDVITGASHFRVSLERALQIMSEMRGHISGLCMPTMVIDIPGGHGKVPLVPNAIVDEDEDFIYLSGFKKGRAAYPKR